MTEPSAAARRPRASRGWRARFLAGLAETSNVTAAAAAAGIGPGSVYKTKREDGDFAEAWLVALCEGYDRLELELLARLRHGEAKPGEGTGRRYDNATALRLLLAHRETRARLMARQDNVSAEEVRASIEAKLARLRERVLEREAREGKGEEAEAEAGDAAA